MFWKYSKSIFEKVGYDEQTKECNEKGKCEVCQIVVTSGYQLKDVCIIHAVTPRKSDYNNEDEAIELLRNTYRNVLKWIKDNGIKSVGFPLLAGGFKGFGKAEAWRIGLEECKRFLKQNEGYSYDITFGVIDEASYVCGQNILNAINGDSYIYPEVVKDEREGCRR